jgi:hypothetical protein
MVLRKIEAGQYAAPFFDDATVQGDPALLVQAVYNMGRDSNDEFDQATYDDMVATGHLRLIDDPGLRASIKRAYTVLERVEVSRRPYRDEYLKGVRGWIPQRIVERLREECEEMMRVDWTCPIPDLDPAETASIVARWTSEDALLAFRLREQGLSQERGVIDQALNEVEEALGRITAAG